MKRALITVALLIEVAARAEARVGRAHVGSGRRDDTTQLHRSDVTMGATAAERNSGGTRGQGLPLLVDRIIPGRFMQLRERFERQPSVVLENERPPAAVSAHRVLPLRFRKRSVAQEVAAVTETVDAPLTRSFDKKRVLMLISDTGGGHRASAQAVESMIEQVRPGATDVRIVDVFTDYCPWPYNKFVTGYQTMAKNPWMWQYSWHTSAVPVVMNGKAPLPSFARPPMSPSPKLHPKWTPLSIRTVHVFLAVMNFFTQLRCGPAVEQCLREHQPDMIVSLHPLTQALPLTQLERMAKREGHTGRTIPFATVVTDLGSAHPWWFSSKVDACFIPRWAHASTRHRSAHRRALCDLARSRAPHATDRPTAAPHRRPPRSRPAPATMTHLLWPGASQ